MKGTGPLPSRKVTKHLINRPLRPLFLAVANDLVPARRRAHTCLFSSPPALPKRRPFSYEKTGFWSLAIKRITLTVGSLGANYLYVLSVLYAICLLVRVATIANHKREPQFRGRFRGNAEIRLPFLPSKTKYTK